MGHDNRREHTRRPGRGLAGHLRSSTGRNLPGIFVENISMGGLFLRTVTTLPVGTEVSLELVRRNLKKMISLTGHVVSQVTPSLATERGSIAGMGVRFDPYTPEIEGRLRELMDALTTAPDLRPSSPPIRIPPPPPVIIPAAPPPITGESMEFAPTFAPEHFGAGRVVAVPESEPLDANVQQLQLELTDLRGELDRQKKLVASLRGALDVMRNELMTKEQDNAELASRLLRYEQ